MGNRVKTISGEKRHYVRCDLVPGYEDDQYEPGTQNKDRFASRTHAFDANDIDDIDSIIAKMYNYV